MRTQITDEQKLAPVLQKFDQRYVPQEKFAKIESSVEEIRRSVAEMRAGGILHDEYKDGPNGQPKVLVAKALFAQAYRRVRGSLPPGRDDKEARQYRVIAEWEKKAFSSASDANGGLLIPEEWNAEVIPTLKAESVVFAIGPTIRKTNRDVYHWPKFTSKKTFAWSGENAPASDQTPSTDEIVFTPKKAIGLSVVSTEWLEDADPETDASLRAELLGSLGEFLDDSFLEGSGANRPTGLRSISGITSRASGGAIDYNDLVDLESDLKGDNVRPPFVWIMHSNTTAKLKKLKDSNGLPIFWSNPGGNGTEMPQPLGYRIFESSQISLTEGASSNESYILLVKPEDVLIAMRRDITVALSEHAGFASDQVQIRLTARVDLNVKYVESVGVLTGITS